MATKDFSSLIHGRESSLIIGTVNGVMHIEGKMTLVIVDAGDWVLRVSLLGEAVTSALVTYQRQWPIIEASTMLSHLKIDQRVEKARLTLAFATPRTTLHLRAAEFAKMPIDFATAWSYAKDYEAKKTKGDFRRYTMITLGEGNPTDEPGGSVRFVTEGGDPFTAYTSRSLTRTEILSWRMTSVLVTHTRLSKRPNGGFHTTHSTCMMRRVAFWRQSYPLLR